MFNKLWTAWCAFNLEEDERLRQEWQEDPKGFGRRATATAAVAILAGGCLGLSATRHLANKISILGCYAHPMASEAYKEAARTGQCGVNHFD